MKYLKYILLMLLIPCITNAKTYSGAVNIANDYITNHITYTRTG